MRVRKPARALYSLWAVGCICVATSAAWGAAAPADAPAPRPAPVASPAVGLSLVRAGFENASPLQWDVDPDGTVNVRLLYDYERDSPNRAAGHFHFQLQGRPDTELNVVLHNFDNVYNGRPGAAVSGKSICYLSEDGRRWRVVPAEFLPGDPSADSPVDRLGSRLRVRVKLDGPSLYLARLEPYRLSDLDRLLDEVRKNPRAEVADVGRTVEGRPLEIVRVGDPEAPRRVLLRARAHPWEPGGNWVVQGLIRSLLADDPVSRRCLQRYCVYVMPMANKDGVARGGTRFNMQGRDLNRNWDKPADPDLAPENHALEGWIERMRAAGKVPDLAVCLHNDESGGLHISRPPARGPGGHVERMKRLEQLLRRHTWFTEGSSGPPARNVGTLGDGLLERYGIDACVLEFNCNWAAGLKQPPTGEAWEQFGEGLREVFYHYFAPHGEAAQ